MSIKTILISISVLIGTYALGIPILYSVLAFNVTLWGNIAYNLVTSDEEEIVANLLAETATTPPDSMQIEFERFLLKKYLEFTKAETRSLNEGIRLLEDSLIPVSRREAVLAEI